MTSSASAYRSGTSAARPRDEHEPAAAREIGHRRLLRDLDRMARRRSSTSAAMSTSSTRAATIAALTSAPGSSRHSATSTPSRPAARAASAQRDEVVQTAAVPDAREGTSRASRPREQRDDLLGDPAHLLVQRRLLDELEHRPQRQVVDARVEDVPERGSHLFCCPRSPPGSRRARPAGRPGHGPRSRTCPSSTTRSPASSVM